MAAGQVDGTPVVVTGGADGIVQVWDSQTGAARGESLRGHPGGVRALAVGEVDGTTVAVTGGRHGTACVWDLPTGAARGKLRIPAGAFHQLLLRLRRLHIPVWAVALGEVDGTPVAVTGGLDGMWVWDPRAGPVRGKPLLSGGALGRRLHLYGTLRYGARTVAVGAVDGTPVVISSYGHRGAMVWDLRTRVARGEPLFADQAGTLGPVAVGEVDGIPMAVTSGEDHTVQVWDLRARAMRGEPLRGHTHAIEAVAIGEMGGTPMVASGDSNGTIMMWSLDCDQAASARLEAIAGITAIAFAGQIGLVTSTKDGSLFSWRPARTLEPAPHRS